jgi:hypothetical protein
MAEYLVTIPIAGHLEIMVEAESEEAAIEQAFESDYTIDNLADWEAVRAFNEGNVCYCPQPWEATAEEIE